MIEISNVEAVGWSHAIRGMRNPLNSWSKSDSVGENVGEEDLKLMTKLSKAGNDHSKFMRYIVVYADITAPDYWFKEFSTYKVGVTENSTSTMHKIAGKEFTLDDFSVDHLNEENLWLFEDTIIRRLNTCRDFYLQTKSKDDWWQMIQLLPMSYNYKRTVVMNYQVLKNMYHSRKNHKLDCWRDFCKWVESLPYAKELICDTD